MMDLWTLLNPALSAGVPVIQAILPAILAGASVIGGLLGKAGKARAEGRQAQTDITLARDQQALSRAAEQRRGELSLAELMERAGMNRARFGLDRAQFGISAPQARTRQVALGDLLSRIQDTQLDLPASVPRIGVRGGLRPSALGPLSRRAGQGLAAQALQALMSGSDIPEALAAFEAPTLSPIPGLSTLPKAGKLDKFLNIAGTIGGLAGGAGALLPGGEGFSPLGGIEGGPAFRGVPAELVRAATSRQINPAIDFRNPRLLGGR